MIHQTKPNPDQTYWTNMWTKPLLKFNIQFQQTLICQSEFFSYKNLAILGTISKSESNFFLKRYSYI